MSNDKPLCISYDASSTVGPRTGVGIATAELLNELVEVLPEGWSLRAFVNSPRHPVPLDSWATSPRVELHFHRLSGKALLRAWQYLRLPRIERFVGNVDIHHSPAGYPTPAKNALRVLNVHDLFFLQEARPDPYGGGYFAATYEKRLAEQGRIILFSEQTRRELCQRYPVDPLRTVVIPHGVDHRFFQAVPSAQEHEVIAKWSKGEPYFLCVATVGPRKNLALLVDAYARFAAQAGVSSPKLLLTGQSGNSEPARELEAAIASMNLQKNIVRTGYVDREHLPMLYRHALALLMPSLDEGFGLPVLEAMACGCPVVAANRGSLPEVAGDAGLLVDVSTPEPLAQEMERLWRSEERRVRLRELGLKRAAGFTWRRAAEGTVEVYRELAAEQ